MQVFDTHRLSYHKAKLRAWSNVAKTVPVKFYDMTDPFANTEAEIGTEVVTDSAGYLFYGNGTTKVNCLVVHDPCIIEVSVDGGASWQIQWITEGDGASPLSPDDIKSLQYYDDQHSLAEYNPAINSAQLPDYLRRDEFSPGTWAEGEIMLDDESCEINQWTRKIIVLSIAPDTITISGSLRAGQVINIFMGKTATVTIGGTARTLKMGHTYIWMANTVIADISVTAQQNYVFDQTANNETLTSAVVPTEDILAIHLHDHSYTGATIEIPAPTKIGTQTVIVTADSSTSADIVVGARTAVQALNSNALAVGKLVAWINAYDNLDYYLVF